MDYSDLFNDTDRLDAGDNFRCFHYREEHGAHLECPSRYLLLFVLKGSLEMRFRYQSCHVEAGEMIVIDSKLLTDYLPVAGTVVLAYLPPLRLTFFFSHCSMAFHSAYSEIVTILPLLRVWINVQLTDYARGIRCSGDDAYRQRKEMARIILAYPRGKLGELLAPFSFCSSNDCSGCREAVLRSEPAK